MSVIAVFSGSYCSAEEVVSQVAQRLGYHEATQELVDRAAQQSGLAQEKITRALLGSRTFFDGFTREWERSLVHLKAALAHLLGTDDQIIHSPATHLIPPTISHVLRVHITADEDYRVQQAMAAEKMDRPEALRRIEQDNENIAQWNQRLVAFVAADPALHDIKLRVPALSPAEAAEAICDNVVKDPLKPTARSLQAVLDFQLATTIGVALVDRKQYSCDVVADQGVVNIVINQKPQPTGKLARTLQALRFENAEDEVRDICSKIQGIQEVHVRPGRGYHKVSRTLLVDDEKDYVMTLSERLEMRDIESDVVHDGQEALTFVKTGNPDVMVLDLRMPGMHGFEVLQRIKRDHPHVEVIIVTGHGGKKDRELALQYGAFDYMDKPVDINELAEKIREASLKAERQKRKGAREPTAAEDE
jgi:CheY-like chemotaxis protein